ncbi:hypothetical protein [Clostridium sp.]|uniref:hypothetical protein n=1 Tax=Clostridium sp. TaxID=1506 RepID=UPI0025C0EC68|nr:hypothetical protein [Clostridium sp.]
MNKRNMDEMWEKAMLRGKDVKKMLQELSDKIELMQEDHNDLVESYRKLKDEKFKDEEIKRLKEELDFYQRNTLVTLSDKQRENARRFQKEHYENCETGMVSFKYTIIPTGIGNVVEIRCPKCGEILDLTDYDLW